MVYACSCIGLISSAFGMIGFFTFLPKYIETQFDVTASEASMILVCSSAFPAAAGSFISGFMTSRLRMGLLELARANILLGIVTLSLRLVFLGLGCSIAPVHGVSDNHNVNFTENCNIDCSCSLERFNPACGSDGQTYFTACHAGCTIFNETYMNCSCIPDGLATKGECREECAMLIPFGAVLFLTSFLSGLGFMPGVMLLLRSIEDRDKALALGVLMFLFAIVGIPAPIVFGSIIDGTCLFKSPGGACQVYDKDPLRIRMLGSSFGLSGSSVFLGLYIWWYLWRKKWEDSVYMPRRDAVMQNGTVITFNGHAFKEDKEFESTV